ncbi:probable L-type lectin-domain containing receptor kinase S.5 [Dioscorea cayenensis subsp. rotundata]|uniref:Probable L-type lectin-domain containing receptor kinase S.5 n=1 Tax=Dioscorea cayennensis subsp. rotundata TaxID=55577 RepID=A0AB40D1A5_DIOCR|nr:probable L-type lectin-domain containing receptor kinase S.5 [Dioscorea cayenensis subsp. rotundata]
MIIFRASPLPTSPGITQIPDFFFSVDTGVSQNALQITPDTSNVQDNYLVNKSGRVIFNTPFQLWQPLNSTTKRSASFNTSILVNVFRVNQSVIPGEGIAFAILPSLDDPPAGSHGGYLGLTNETLDGKPSNRFVAIELDTVQQSYDPDNNHIGLDINSVKNQTTAPLTPFGIEIVPVTPTKYTVWIDYDGVNHRIDVFMAKEGVAKPGKPALTQSLDISLFVSQWSYFGFSASTSSNYELHCVLGWNLTIEILPGDKKSSFTTWKIVVILVALLVVLITVFGLVVSFYMKRRKVRDDPSVLMGALKSLPGTPREFEFKELKKATNNFDEKLKLGQGGFGIVYKGVLAGENAEVAVKMFSRDRTKCQDDFLHELTIINRLRHKHLVKLLGWCHKNGLLLLVYEYMPNGSLDQHLFINAGDDRPLLPWDRRYTIIADVASALHYLHNEYDQRVVHRDLKASNIMLDSLFNARLGDFGLARALETDKTSYAELELGGVPGTMGYIAPECFHTGKATRESDLYAFGAVVLETVSGKRPRCDISGFQFLVDWVWKLYREGRLLDAVDGRLAGEFDGEKARRLLLLGLACSNPAAGERPKAEVVVQIIYGTVEPPVIPPFRPAFVWPSAAVVGDDLESSTKSSVVTSSYYGSSAGWTSQCLSKEVHASTLEDVSLP